MVPASGSVRPSTLPWRIVLTSRPSSWRHQLTINDTDDSHRVGELQPLRYPGDVEPFIQRWFAGQPERGNDLAAQIARRPGLQQAATVPLILAFYCIVGGTGPLPDFRRDLYTKVLNRMLTGRWRDDDDRQPDADTCLQTLRAWAWDGATSHPVSGVGTWADDIPAKRVRLGEADADAVDHVATPLGPPDVDTGKTLRRFIHRSIREHLVAEHVASLPVDQAVKVLLPHLWYDPDWEYAAPAALAMHPQRDQLLRDLICRAARSDQIPGDLSVIDAGWEVRGLLARVAAESSEADWSPEVAGMIGQARVELARSGRFGDLGGAAHWGTSDRQAREALLGLLARETDSDRAARLAGAVASSPRRRRTSARPATRCSGCWPARPTAGWPHVLAGGVAQLDPTAEDKRQARDALLGLLARETAAGGRSWRARWPARPDGGGQAPGPRRAARAAGPRDQQLGGRTAGGRGGPARPDGGGQAPGPRRAARAAGPRDRQLGGRRAGGRGGPARPDGGGQAPGPRRAARAAGPRDQQLGGRRAGGRVAQLDPTAEDKRQARDALLGLLARETDSRVAAGWRARWPSSTRRRRTSARPATRCSGCWPARPTAGWPQWLAGAAGPARADGGGQAPGPRRAARAAGPRDRQPDGRRAGGRGWPSSTPTAEDKRQARDALLGLLARETDSRVAAGLAGGVAQLDPTAEDKRQARDALLGLLACRDRQLGAAELAGAVAALDDGGGQAPGP